MKKSDISKEFQSKKDDYNRLGKNLVDALKMFLNDHEISYLEIYHRVKKFDSFFEKIDRKGYSDPFTEVEDLCGIRIICYYASDLEKINEIINNEFKVLEQQDKSLLLGLKEFAYRSNHYIVSVKKSWLGAPNYRKLEGLKSEIQVRTILMHAWAEIEHKLNYKSDAQVPDKFQRKLFRLSAKFEEADEQFEELRVGIENYKSQLSNSIAESDKFDLNQDFNLNTFTVYIKYKFQGEDWSDGDYSDSFESFSNLENTFTIINKAIDKVQPHFEEIVEDLEKNDYGLIDRPKSLYLLWFAVGVVNPDRYKLIKDSEDSSWKTVAIKWRKKIKAGNNV